jgi:rhodanese-related sulfurtransferase
MENQSKIPHITCEHLQKIKSEAGPEHTVIDLRDTVEFDAGHIEGSFNVPRRELKTNIENIVPHRSHRVIVVVGPSHKAEIEHIYEELRELGYEQIEFLAGGFDRWCEISLPNVDEVLNEMTPEEMGFVSDEEEADVYEGDDPEEKNEPLM